MIGIKYKEDKKGQAAIEFLMTYGWMLLIVLIVGALIFSFVDFGSLLPNKVELNNNLRAHQTESFVKGGSDSHALVVFTYTGTPRISINVSSPADAGIIVSDVDSSNCTLAWLKNVDTDGWAQNGTNTTSQGIAEISTTGNPDSNNEVTFINGQQGIAEFWCSENQLVGDILEGKITVKFKNIKTGVPTPSSGAFRVTITE
jgi:hypothetical protein